MINKIERGGVEIKIGGVKILYALSRISPSLALRVINRVDSVKS
jgi:hypothetical protein